MVDVDEIRTKLGKHFIIKGTFYIDPQTGRADVNGGVELITPMAKMPVQFGHVSGKFSCSESGLESLEGCPQTVVNSFSCSKNRLTTLVGGPSTVGGGFWCANNYLSSLEGAPDYVVGILQCDGNPLKSLNGLPSVLKGGIWLEYSPTLPLLRLLDLTGFMISYSPDAVKDILNKYKGQGKPGALKAAAELVRAGYKDNARW